MDCSLAREALSARIDGEREPVPAARVDEHLGNCDPCRKWYAAAVAQTQLLRRLAGRSQLAAVPEPARRKARAAGRTRGSWPRWALAAMGVLQIGLAGAQALGAHPGLPHAERGEHLLNESTAWTAALGAVMLIAAIRPRAAVGLAWVLAGFVAVLAAYEVSDAVSGEVTVDRVVSHLPALFGAVLAVLVSRRDQPVGPEPVADGVPTDIVLPDSAIRGRRRGHLYPTDGSAA